MNTIDEARRLATILVTKVESGEDVTPELVKEVLDLYERAYREDAGD